MLLQNRTNEASKYTIYWEDRYLQQQIYIQYTRKYVLPNHTSYIEIPSYRYLSNRAIIII